MQDQELVLSLASFLYEKKAQDIMFCAFSLCIKMLTSIIYFYSYVSLWTLNFYTSKE